MVWIAGKATWQEGPYLFHGMDGKHHYPPVLCEVCGAPATGIAFEEVDVTQPDDKVRCSLPGRPHHFCRSHGLNDGLK